jgi:hypothetical protein
MEIRANYRKTTGLGAAMIALMMVAGSAGAAQTHDLTMSGSGMVTTLASEGCATSPDGCAVTMTGSLIGQSVGNSSFAATVTTNWLGALDTGTAASQCAPATGSLTVTAANNATVVVTLNGLSCDIPVDGAAAQTFDGSFYVTDSTGNLSGIKGTGRVTLSMDPGGDVMLLLHGVF